MQTSTPNSNFTNNISPSTSSNFLNNLNNISNTSNTTPTTTTNNNFPQTVNQVAPEVAIPNTPPPASHINSLPHKATATGANIENNPTTANKRVMIIAIILALCGLCGVALWIMGSNQTSIDEIFADTLHNTLSAQKLIVSGQLNYPYQDSFATSGIESLQWDFYHQTDLPHIANSGFITINFANNQEPRQIAYHSFVDGNGQIYAQIDGVRNLVAALKPQDSTFITKFAPSFDLFERQWWLIDVPKTLSEQTLYPIEADAGSTYLCFYNTWTSALNSEQLYTIYREHPFLKLTTYTGQALTPIKNGIIYQINLDQTELNTFYEYFLNTSIGQNLQNCTQNGLPTSLADNHENNNWPEILIELDKKNLRVAQIHYQSAKPNGLQAIISLDYVTPPQINPPDDNTVKPIGELIEQIMSDIMNNLDTETITDYPTSYTLE